MAYWHQDKNGKWYIDWSHFVVLIPIAVYVVFVIVRRLWESL